MSAERWLLPRLGDVDVAAEAVDFVRYVLDNRPTATATSADVAADAVGDVEAVEHLVELFSTLVNLSAVLAVAAAARTGQTPAVLLNTISLHQRARDDLARLDDGSPFGDEP